MLQLSRIIFFQLQGAEVYVACFGEDKSDAAAGLCTAECCSRERSYRDWYALMHKENQKEGETGFSAKLKFMIEVDSRKT